MTWLYEDKVFDLNEEELERYQGFVYEVEEVDTGMKYIGKKFFWKKKVLPKNKSRKRRIITRVQSDWKDYHVQMTKSNNCVKRVNYLNAEYYTYAERKENVLIMKQNSNLKMMFYFVMITIMNLSGVRYILNLLKI